MEDKQEKKNWCIYNVKCCNPYKELKHPKTQKKNIRNVTESMCSINADITMGMKICDKCRIKVYSEFKIKEQVDSNVAGTSQDDNVDETFTDPGASIDYLNKSLELIGESPIKKKKLVVESYSKKSLKK